MCLGSTPDIKPPPPPAPPTSTAKVAPTPSNASFEVNSSGQKVRRGVGSLRIDKSAAGNGLHIPS